MSEQAVAAKADMEAISRSMSSPGRISSLHTKTAAFHVLLMAVTVSAVITVGVLGALVIYILANGIMNLSPELFAWKYTTENVSMLPAIINTFLMTALSLLIAVPIGICSAIYLVEYAKRGNKLVSIVRITTETLSGIPSIVYGLFGYLMFVIAFGWGLSFFGGALTLSIMVLPTIMRTTEEALLSVPDSYREGSFGLGAGRLRTIFKVVLPSAVPGILSGVILAIGRIVGETAALIFTSGTTARYQRAYLIPDVHWLFICISCFRKDSTQNRHMQPQLCCL